MFNKELIRFFLHKFRWHVLVISVTFGILIFLLTMIFPSMDTNSAGVISTNWPQLMKDMFGDPVFGFTDIYGWLELEVFHITFWVVFGIFASFMAANIIAKEYENKTIDLILSTPINRAELLVNRLVSLVILLLVSILPVIVGCIAGIAVHGLEIRLLSLLAASLNGLLLCLLFAGLSLLISVFIHSQTITILISLAIFGFFFLLRNMLIPVIPALNSLAVLSPFHYYDTATILIRNSYFWLNPVILFLSFVFLSFMAVLLFGKRDVIY